LPPILFDAAWNTSIPDFKRQFSKISLLAVGLVLITTTVIAVVVHSIIPGFNWAISFCVRGNYFATGRDSSDEHCEGSSPIEKINHAS
jgi:hypothetical protein